MANEIQQQANEEGQGSLPALAPGEMKRRLKYFGVGAIPTTLLFTYMSQGQIGESMVLGVIVASTLAYFEPEIHKTIGPGMRAARHLWDYLNRNNSGRARSRLLDKEWWLTGEASVPYAEPDGELEEPDAPMLETAEVAEGAAIPGKFSLGRDSLAVLRNINNQRSVYFGKTATGHVILSIKDMYHVLDVAKSGNGKSNRFRSAMMQVVDMADTFYLNPFAAPVKSVTDDRQIEVWQPIFDRLANRHPVREDAEIMQVLTGLVEEIKRRNEQELRRDFSWRQRPIFVFIDELPEIFARVPDAVDLIDRIGRGGRQFGIFAWIASQTAQVKDLGLTTACQAQFKTLLYGGGDKVSSSRIIGGVTTEQEKTLKKNAGLTLMVADGVDDAEFVRAPLITNEALFTFLGLPPFQLEEWLTPPDDREFSGSSRIVDVDLSSESFVRKFPGSPPEVPSDTPQFYESEPVERPESNSEGFEPRPDDLILDEMQLELLVVYYKRCTNVNKSLEQIRNERGQGLGARYSRHASWFLEQRGLKKRRS